MPRKAANAPIPAPNRSKRSAGVTEFLSLDLYSSARKVEKAVNVFKADENHNGIKVEQATINQSSAVNVAPVAPKKRRHTKTQVVSPPADTPNKNHSRSSSVTSSVQTMSSVVVVPPKRRRGKTRPKMKNLAKSPERRGTVVVTEGWACIQTMSPVPVVAPMRGRSEGKRGAAQKRVARGRTPAKTKTTIKQEILSDEEMQEEIPGTESPPCLSLLAPLATPLDITAEKVLEISKKRKNLYAENVAPPSPPTPPQHNPGVNLHPEGSTYELLQVRTQYKMPPDLNVKNLGLPTWSCDSQQGFTSIRKYAEYQAENFKRSLKEESSAKYGMAETALKRRKMMEENSKLKEIKFGTNIDLSDDVKFKAQLTELAKMPPFCRVIADSNLLSHLGHTILGMNTVQLYMKVPGNRTPVHTENNSLASVNINIGAGNCEWFGVPYEYWGVIDKKCREEKPGDLVWVGAGCVHWVQSTGWCNNVAWNVGPMTFSQMMMAMHQYEWNKVQNYKSLVPMQHLFWQIAKNVYNLVRGMIIRSLSYCKMIVDWAERHNMHVKYQPRMHDEHSHYCCLCQVEVFNLLFVKEEEKAKGTYGVWCVDCARRGNIMDYTVLQQINFVDLNEIFNKFQLHMVSMPLFISLILDLEDDPLCMNILPFSNKNMIERY